MHSVKRNCLALPINIIINMLSIRLQNRKQEQLVALCGTLLHTSLFWHYSRVKKTGVKKKLRTENGMKHPEMPEKQK